MGCIHFVTTKPSNNYYIDYLQILFHGNAHSVILNRLFSDR